MEATQRRLSIPDHCFNELFHCSMKSRGRFVSRNTFSKIVNDDSGEDLLDHFAGNPLKDLVLSDVNP